MRVTKSLLVRLGMFGPGSTPSVTSSGSRGCLPYMRKNGENPVDEFTMVLYVNKVASTYLCQSVPYLLHIIDSDALKNLWNRSQVELACGCRPLVLCLLMPSLLHMSFNCADVKAEALSLARYVGIPCFVIKCVYSVSAIVSVFSSRIGIARGHLVKASTTVRIFHDVLCSS